ncbi:MAG: DUF3341 domain-containing protein [Anaerolineae bacterium]
MSNQELALEAPGAKDITAPVGHDDSDEVAEPPYGLMAEFDEPHDLIQAVEKVRAAGYKKYDAYSPYPMHGLNHSMGLSQRPMSWIMVVGGIVGIITGIVLQYWVAVIVYPLNVGGRPLVSWPAWGPVTFELMILTAAICGFLAVWILNGLPEPYHPTFNVPRFAQHASIDSFFLVIEAKDPLYDPIRTRSFIESLKPREVFDVPS